MASKPTIFFIHGAFHSSIHLEPFSRFLNSHGYPTHCPDLPTSKGLSTTDAYEDAAFVESEIGKLVESEGKDVVVLLHSYGGFVPSMALPEAFAKKQRLSKGLPGGIVRLLYIAAIVVPIGKNVGSKEEGNLHPMSEVLDNDLIWMGEPGHVFYNDVPASEAEYAISKLHPQSLICFSKPATREDHKLHPNAYLFCAKDQAIPLEGQKAMAKELGENAVTETVDAGHSPFMSQPDAVLKFIERLIT